MLWGLMAVYINPSKSFLNSRLPHAKSAFFHWYSDYDYSIEDRAILSLAIRGQTL